MDHGAVKIVLAHSTSRLTRRTLEYGALIELTTRTGHAVVSVPVQLDTADERDRG